MNQFFTIAAKIVYVICQAFVFVIVELIAAVYMKIYKIKMKNQNRNYEEEINHYLEA